MIACWTGATLTEWSAIIGWIGANKNAVKNKRSCFSHKLKQACISNKSNEIMLLAGSGLREIVKFL